MTHLIMLLVGLGLLATACTTPPQTINAHATATQKPIHIPPMTEIAQPDSCSGDSLFDLYSRKIIETEIIYFPDGTSVTVPSNIFDRGLESWWSKFSTDFVNDPEATGGVSYYEDQYHNPNKINDRTGCSVVAVKLPQIGENSPIPPQFYKVLAIKETAGTIIACDLVYNTWDLDQQIPPEHDGVLASFMDRVAALSVMEEKNPFGIQYKGDPEWDKITENFGVNGSWVTTSIINTVGYLCLQNSILPPQANPVGCDYSAIPTCP